MIIKFNLPDIEQILGGIKSLYELEENEALALVQGIIDREISNNASPVKLQSFEQGCPDSWHGLISNIEWSISWDEDYEEGTIELTQIDEERQKQEIKEILAGLSKPMPGLAAFFYVMQKKMVDEGISYGDAWNWVTGADGDHSLAQPLGDAIADFREYELIPRLEYEPDVDALDEALEEWITYHDWAEGEEDLNYWKQNKKWPQMRERLKGTELIEKVEASSGLGKSELAIACGYEVLGLDGKTKAAFTEFYEALLEARGISME